MYNFALAHSELIIVTKRSTKRFAGVHDHTTNTEVLERLWQQHYFGVQTWLEMISGAVDQALMPMYTFQISCQTRLPHFLDTVKRSSKTGLLTSDIQTLKFQLEPASTCWLCLLFAVSLVVLSLSLVGQSSERKIKYGS